MTTLENTFIKTKEAIVDLIGLSNEQIDGILNEIAEEAILNSATIIAENSKDLARMDKNDPKYDRLLLNEERIIAIANDIKNVANLTNPVGEILEENTLENGLNISKIRVPIGVIGVIYEARPNVSFDVFALCFKTKNACVLKGGSDAEFSNIAIVNTIHKVLVKNNINTHIVNLLPSDRSATAALLNATAYVDIIIPRGSQGLINFVREHAKVPVIETGAGIVHTYIDEDVDTTMAAAIITNAKTRRVSVCNSLDCVLIHQSQLVSLPKITAALAEKETVIYADSDAYKHLNAYPQNLLHKAQENHFGTEFLANILAIKTVANLDEALAHIAKYSSKHSEAIVSNNVTHIERFLNYVDAAAVYANTSTAFTDGAQFGLGAEIGISTQKLHARGPMALKEITSYKWVVRGNGQIRN